MDGEVFYKDSMPLISIAQYPLLHSATSMLPTTQARGRCSITRTYQTSNVAACPATSAIDSPMTVTLEPPSTKEPKNPCKEQLRMQHEPHICHRHPQHDACTFPLQRAWPPFQDARFRYWRFEHLTMKTPRKQNCWQYKGSSWNVAVSN